MSVINSVLQQQFISTVIQFIDLICTKGACWCRCINPPDFCKHHQFFRPFPTITCWPWAYSCCLHTRIDQTPHWCKIIQTQNLYYSGVMYFLYCSQDYSWYYSQDGKPVNNHGYELMMQLTLPALCFTATSRQNHCHPLSPLTSDKWSSQEHIQSLSIII